MTTKTASAHSAAAFTSKEMAAFNVLRHRYRHDPEIFRNRELAQLRLLRWRCKNGDLAASEEHEPA